MHQDNIIEFKGTKKGIYIQIKPEIDFQTIKKLLVDKLEDSKSFFKGAKILDIHCDTLSSDEKVELSEIMSNRYHMCVNMEEASPILNINQVFDGIHEGITRFHYGTVRSGQKLHIKGNLVILGDVNPGAEVIALGNIIVMGSLRGIAHAGGDGNKNARVAAIYLDPTQLRIADVITRAPDGEYEKPLTPEQAYIKDNMVCIEPFLIRKQN
ncbi:septum site-determining protein MinC [Alkaliphilus pronyensis]|uniref:Probable septum site-determining protein MinC n=1 Tax=Alkaliphilus pronyensis TaxID=1482732 RepID=A0A6I0F3I1_9FIRM|nr:septum site-determining protein MinC [Alkaliphilus pronyensis]KAB3535912.1 septum site-determining protein MinC [Alkaliphilus pronyensis]